MKKNMEEPNNIKFRLLSITNERTTSIADVPFINEESLKFQYKTGTIVKLGENIITVIPSIRYMDGDTFHFESSAEFNYSVLSLGDIMVVDKENNKLNVKANILPTLIGAAYSSLRGIVYARTLTTPLEKFPIPIIDINTLMLKNGISVLE